MDEASEPKPEAGAEDVTAVQAAVEAEPPRDEDLVLEEAEPTPGVSRTVFVVSIVAAMLVAGVAGVAIGWKVEQQRVKDDLANIRPIGTVTAVDDDSVTVELQTASGSKTYEISDQTEVGGSGEMTEGSVVLIRSWSGVDGGARANKIVVLPDGQSDG